MFHVLDLYPLKKSHELYPVFIATLRDAFFIMNMDDYEIVRNSVRDKLRKAFPNETAESIESRLKSVPGSHFTRGARRKIPEVNFALFILMKPGLLEERVDAVVQTFRHIDDRFITEEVMHIHGNVLKHIRNNCLSDEPGFNLYTVKPDGTLKSLL